MWRSKGDLEEQESGPFRSFILGVLWVKLGLSHSFTEPSHSPWEAFSVAIRDVALPASPGETHSPEQQALPSSGGALPSSDVYFCSFPLGRWESAVLETLGLMSLT